LGNKHLKLLIFHCNATLPKAPRSDCEALLADLDKETDSDEFFCPQFCRDPQMNLTVTIGETRRNGKCKLQAVTNILGGDFDGTGCDGMCLSLSDVKHFVQQEVSTCDPDSSDLSALAIAPDRDPPLGKIVKVCLGSEPQEPTCRISEHGT
jgi:hypothetical protein